MAAALWDRIDQRLDAPRLRFVALSLLAITLVLTALSFATADRNHTMFGPPLGADFAGFYTAGMIWNQYGGERLYDGPLQDAVYHDLLPGLNPDEKLPFVHPPFVALPFRLLALLPYEAAFAVWLMTSAALYLTGLALLRRALPSFPRPAWTVAVLLALSFEPFIMECWLGGQLSAVAFFLVALALFFADRQRPVAAGAALGFLLYKPTLLVLLLPMLVVARRLRMLAGFALTGIGLAALSFLTVGRQGCVNFLNTLLGFAGTASGQGLQLRAWKYVDLNSFLRLLTGAHPPLNALLLLFLTAPLLFFLAVAWWRWDRLDADQRRLIWAATVIGTLVANVYVGVYDSVLCVLGVLLTADVLFRRSNAALPPAYRFGLFVLYLVPWVSQPLARAVYIQPYTVVLAALAVYSLWLARAKDLREARGAESWIERQAQDFKDQATRSPAPLAP
jgi:hypothetical protein